MDFMTRIICLHNIILFLIQVFCYHLIFDKYFKFYSSIKMVEIIKSIYSILISRPVNSKISIKCRLTVSLSRIFKFH